MSDERDVVHVYKNKQAWEWHDLYQAALKGWHEEAADLKQQLAEVTQEREQCVRDMSGWMDNGETLSQAICAMRLSASTFKQQLATVQAELASHAWTVSPAMADAQIHQLNLKIIGLEETIAIHTACATALKQQLAQVRTERNESYMTIATLRGHLDVLCQAIEAREHDEDYLRRRAAEGRMALAQGRGA